MTIWTLDEFLDAWSVMCRKDIPLPKCNITIEYLCTPVVLELGTEGVTQVQAWGRTLEGDGGFDEGYISFSINDFTDGTLYINGLENSWLVTETETFHYPYEHGIHTWFYNNGDPEYHKVAGAAYYMEQSETLPLDSATDRGNLYDEYGTVEMVDGAPVFTLVERTLMGDVYDFDAIFEKAIADGLEGYEGCESADDVLARNKERGIDWLTYPIDQ